jgi:hypothetical protein
MADRIISEDKMNSYKKANYYEKEFANNFNSISNTYKIVSSSYDNCIHYLGALNNMLSSNGGNVIFISITVRDYDHNYLKRVALPDFIVLYNDYPIGFMDLKSIDSQTIIRQYNSFHENFAKDGLKVGYDFLLAVQEKAVEHYANIKEEYGYDTVVMFQGRNYFIVNDKYDQNALMNIDENFKTYSYMNANRLHNFIQNNPQYKFSYESNNHDGYLEKSCIVPLCKMEGFTSENRFNDEFITKMIDNTIDSKQATFDQIYTLY